MVVAIDFGTTYSGFANGTGESLDDIKLNSVWKNRLGLESYKTATSALFNDQGELEEFGFDAEYTLMCKSRCKCSRTLQAFQNASL